MSGVLRGVTIVRSALTLRGPAISRRATIHTDPAKHPFTTFETMFGLGVFGLAILGPSGWILANLESYKSKE